MTYLSYCAACSYGSNSMMERFLRYTNREHEYIPEHGQNLETVVQTSEKPVVVYKTKSYNSYQSPSSAREYFTPYMFLKEHRPLTQFVGDAAEIQLLVEEIFHETMQKQLPQNFLFTVCNKELFKEVHQKYSSHWSNSILGFCINRNPFISSIFVRQSNLDSLIVTLGHEIGHALTVHLGNSLDEEAKAFAFCLAWLETIKKKNIANLAGSIEIEKPAQNCLHNVALDFVRKEMKKGKSPIEIFYALKHDVVSLKK